MPQSKEEKKCYKAPNVQLDEYRIGAGAASAIVKEYEELEVFTYFFFALNVLWVLNNLWQREVQDEILQDRVDLLCELVPGALRSIATHVVEETGSDLRVAAEILSLIMTEDDEDDENETNDDNKSEISAEIVDVHEYSRVAAEAKLGSDEEDWELLEVQIDYKSPTNTQAAEIEPKQSILPETQSPYLLALLKNLDEKPQPLISEQSIIPPLFQKKVHHEDQSSEEEDKVNFLEKEDHEGVGKKVFYFAFCLFALLSI